MSLPTTEGNLPLAEQLALLVQAAWDEQTEGLLTGAADKLRAESFPRVPSGEKGEPTDIRCYA